MVVEFAKKRKRKEIMLKGEFALSEINEGVFLLLKHCETVSCCFFYFFVFVFYSIIIGFGSRVWGVYLQSLKLSKNRKL